MSDKLNRIASANKVIGRLYEDEFKGWLAAYAVTDIVDDTAIVSILIDDEVYRDSLRSENPNGGWFTIPIAEKKIKHILSYIGITDVKINRYMSNDNPLEDFIKMFENVTTLS